MKSPSGSGGGGGGNRSSLGTGGGGVGKEAGRKPSPSSSSSSLEIAASACAASPGCDTPACCCCRVSMDMRRRRLVAFFRSSDVSDAGADIVCEWMDLAWRAISGKVKSQTRTERKTAAACFQTQALYKATAIGAQRQQQPSSQRRPEVHACHRIRAALACWVATTNKRTLGNVLKVVTKHLCHTSHASTTTGRCPRLLRGAEL